MKLLISKLLNFFLVITPFLCIPPASSHNVSHSNNVISLKTKLLEDYRSDIIPNDNQPLNLSMGLVIRAFNNIDQKEGTIELNVWLRYWWNDFNIRWNEDYWNVSSLIFTTDHGSDVSIWTPDIYLYNTAEVPLENLKFSNAMAYPNGDIIWSRPGIIKATCHFDLTNFPFDTQNCELKLGSWSYTGNHLVLKDDHPTIDLGNYQNNEEWTLDNVSYKINAIKYGCCPHNYYDITFNIRLTRLSGYYEQHIIIPTFATASLILITLLIPWNSGERISFAVTVMLSIIVFLLMLSDTLPKSNQKPLLSQMITSLTFFSLFGVLFTVLISALNNYKENHLKNKSKIDNWFIRKIFNLCNYCFCSKTKCYENDINNDKQDKADNSNIKTCENLQMSIQNKPNNNNIVDEFDDISNKMLSIKSQELNQSNMDDLNTHSFKCSQKKIPRSTSYSIANTNTITHRRTYKSKNDNTIDDNIDNNIDDNENEKIKLLKKQCDNMISKIETVYGLIFMMVFLVLCIYMYISKHIYSSS